MTISLNEQFHMRAACDQNVKNVPGGARQKSVSQLHLPDSKLDACLEVQLQALLCYLA